MAAALGLAAGAAEAQPAEDVARLAPVVVTATRSPVDLAQAPAAVTLVTRDEIDLRAVHRLGDALAGVPGLQLRGSAFGSAFPASGAGVITLRGIPRTPRTLVLLDGQPLNNALSGAVNTSGIGMHEVERIEVVRGPMSALYGGHAMGGVVQVFTAVPQRREAFVQAGGGGGTLPRQDYALVLRDRPDATLGWSVAAGYRRSAGWDGSDLVVKTPFAGAGVLLVDGALRTSTPDGRGAWLVGDKGARPWEQFNASFALHHDPRPGVALVAGGAWSRYRVGWTPARSLLRDAGGVPVYAGDLRLAGTGERLALLASDFLTQTPSGEDEWRAFARAEVALSPATVLRANVGWLDHAMRFAQPSAAARPDAGPGEFFDQPSQRADIDVNVRMAVGDAFALTAGASLNRNRLDRTTWKVAYWRDEDTRIAPASAAEGSTWNAAAYAEAQWLAQPWLALNAGLRYDRFRTRGRIEQFTAPAFAHDAPAREDGQWNPKVAAVAALGRDATLRLSYGTGFRAPTLLDLYSRSVAPGATAGAPVVTEPSPDLAPERVRSLEAGIDIVLPMRTRLACSLFAQRLTDLIYRRRESATRNVIVNAGEAKVNGLEVELVQPLPDERLRLVASATHLFRYDVTRNDAVPESVGRRLTDVSRVLYALALEGRWQRWSGSLAWRHAGHAFGSGDDLNRNTVQGVYGSWDRHDVVSARLAREIAPGVTLAVAVDNALDRRHFQFYGQPGRSLHVELAVRR